MVSSGVFEMDFYGDNASNNLLPRMRLGYAEAKNSSGLSIRGGQDWTPVAQQNPGTIDFGVQSWSGNLWWRVPQLTLRYKPRNVEFLVSAMKHRAEPNSQDQQEKMPLGEKFVRNGEAYAGKGLGRAWVPYGFDYIPWFKDSGGNLKGREISSTGGFGSLMFAASEKVAFNGGYGMDDPKDEDLADAGAPYLKNQTIFVNMKYSVTNNFGWGLEFINFTTTKADNTPGAAGARPWT